jgi:predicted PurR-regulated permease PerM
MDFNNITNRTVFRILLIISIFGGLIALAFILHRQLVWLAVAFFLAVALNPAVEALALRLPRRSRSLAAGVVFLATLGLLTFMAFSLIPPLVSQSQALFRSLPDLADSLQQAPNWAGEFVRQHNLVAFIKSNQRQILDRVSGLSGSLVGAARTVASSIAATLTVLVLTFFMILEGPYWLRVFWQLQPSTKRRHRQKLAAEMYKSVTGYVTGNLLTSLIAAAATTIVLSVVGMQFAIPLGIVVGILDLLPLIGAILGSVVVVLLTLLYANTTTAIVVLLFFVLYQQIENHVLQPLVYAKTVKMSPLSVLIAALSGAAAGGLLGALLAIPAAASLQILIKDYIRNHPKN